MLCSVSSERHMQYGVNEPAQVLKRRSNHCATTSHKKYIYSLLLIVTFLHLYSMPGPRIEPQTTTYKADVITGHRDKHYTTAPPTAIMMNKTHADIHQMVSKPIGISHVYAIRHFKQYMGGIDRVYQNVCGEMHMQDRIKDLVVAPAAVLPCYLYVQQTSLLYRALPQR